MNRKLHNTVTALFATSGLLALGLMAAHPAQAPTAPQALLPTAAQVAQVEAQARRIQAEAASLSATAAADLSAQADALASVAEAFDPAPKPQTAPGRTVHRSHRGRQSVAMPFFSFFPKG